MLCTDRSVPAASSRPAPFLTTGSRLVRQAEREGRTGHDGQRLSVPGQGARRHLREALRATQAHAEPIRRARTGSPSGSSRLCSDRGAPLLIAKTMVHAVPARLQLPSRQFGRCVLSTHQSPGSEQRAETQQLDGASVLHDDHRHAAFSLQAAPELIVVSNCANVVDQEADERILRCIRMNVGVDLFDQG